MEVKAKARYIKISPKKVRLVADMVRGMAVADALAQLSFLNKKSAKPIRKLIESAVANAEHNFDLNKDILFIKEIRIDEGPTLKRWMPRAFGRATVIRKRSSHIFVALSEKKNLGKKEKTAIKDQDNNKPKIVSGKKEKATEKTKKDKQKDKEEVKPISSEKPREIFDVRRRGKHRHKEHLDSIRKKEKGGGKAKIFRRKTD